MIHNFAGLAARNNTILRHVLREGFERGRAGRLKRRTTEETVAQPEKREPSRKAEPKERRSHKAMMVLQSYIDNCDTRTCKRNEIADLGKRGQYEVNAIVVAGIYRP